MWDPNTLPTKDIKRGDTSGMGMQEFRLRNNFILLPVPFIGVRNQPDIHSISHAPDMQPFRVGGIYDRPICRRIAEEAGVQRKLFGQSKKAVDLFETEKFGSPSTPQSIKSYVAEREGPVFWFQEKILRTIRSLLDAGMLLPSEQSDPVLRLLRKPFRWLAWRVHVAFYDNVFNFRKYADYEMFWAIEQTGQRYRVGVGSTRPPRPEGTSPQRAG